MNDFLDGENVVPVPIEGYSGRYVVSNYGNIYSLYSNKGRRETPKLRTIAKQKNGHFTVHLRRSENKKYFYTNAWVHQLVCVAFHGPRPSGIHQVAHIDGRTENNRADNLVWATRKENEAHKKLHGTALVRDRNHQTKINTRMVMAILSLNKKHQLTYKQLSVAFDVSEQAIGLAISSAKKLKPNWEEIPKEECIHEPDTAVTMGFEIMSSSCKYCGKQIKATRWDVFE